MLQKLFESFEIIAKVYLIVMLAN